MNALFLTFWGKKYTDDFLKLFLPCLNENLKIIKKNRKNYSLEIWTLIKDKNYIKKNRLFKRVNKKIKCTFKNIDFILNQGKQNKLNKYELHETISYIFKTSQCNRYEYLWFFYPDQFFSYDFISNISLTTKKKKADLTLVPSLNCSQEKINKLFQKKKNLRNNFKKIYLENLDKSNQYVDIKHVDNYQYLKVIDIKKNSLIIQSFHTHPLIFKTKNNFEGFRYPFYPSHDEGISNFFGRKNVFFVNNLKYGVLGGTTQTLPAPKKYNNSLKASIISGILQFNESHLKFSKETFVHGYLTSKNLKERIIKVNDKINLLRHGWKDAIKNLNSYPNIKKNKLFKLNDYKEIIDIIINMELKIKKFYNFKLIYYNKIIFDNFLKYSYSKIYNQKISFKEFLSLSNKKNDKYLNYLYKMYFE